jgi:hypothetical protein
MVHVAIHVLMATTTIAAFQQYATNLNLTDRQENIVANCKNNMVDKIGASLTLHDPQALVIGSWARSTITRYLAEADVDVMVILHYSENEQWFDGEGTVKVLTRFKAILDAAYPKTPCSVDRNCVTMKLSQFRLDVVPAFRWDTGDYRIPDTYSRQWVKTDPIKFQATVTVLNKNMGGTFVPLVKMIKGWNRNAGWPIRSFHLECMLCGYFADFTKTYSYDVLTLVFLEALPALLRLTSHDPTTGERVDEYLDNNAVVTLRATAIAGAVAAGRKARDAFDYQSLYPSTSIPQWKDVFGEFFPAYG